MICGSIGQMYGHSWLFLCSVCPMAEIKEHVSCFRNRAAFHSGSSGGESSRFTQVIGKIWFLVNVRMRCLVPWGLSSGRLSPASECLPSSSHCPLLLQTHRGIRSLPHTLTDVPVSLFSLLLYSLIFKGSSDIIGSTQIIS